MSDLKITCMCLNVCVCVHVMCIMCLYVYLYVCVCTCMCVCVCVCVRAQTNIEFQHWSDNCQKWLCLTVISGSVKCCLICSTQNTMTDVQCGRYSIYVRTITDLST